MKIIIKKSNLLKALNHVQSVVEKRNSIPILANVKIMASDSNIELSTTDMDISITDKVEAEVLEAGGVTIPAITTYEIIKRISEDDDVSLEQSAEHENQTILKFNSSRFVLPTLPVDEFPSFDFTSCSHKFEIDSSELKTILLKTRHAISQEETRYYLNGVFFHSIEVEGKLMLRGVATDGHRLAKVDVEAPEGAAGMPSIIIPRKTVQELIKLLEDYEGKISISLSANKAVFEIGKTKLITKLIDGKFPDYNRVIPANNDKQLEVALKDLSSSIELVVSVSADKVRSVKLELQPSRLTLSASGDINGNASGTQHLDVNYNSDPIAIGFNSKYVLDTLSVIESDMVRLMLSNSSGAVIAKGVNDNNSLYILMPMQV
jgi:DNA polymerase-3 subunit beta